MLLTRCPRCESDLVYPRALWPLDGADCTDCAVERRCPECNHVDHVRTSRAAMGAWERRQERARAELCDLAARTDAGDALAAAWNARAA